MNAPFRNDMIAMALANLFGVAEKASADERPEFTSSAKGPEDMIKDSTQRAGFAHYDKIATSRQGTILMVSEPIWVLRIPEGGTRLVEPGLWLRVKHETAGLWCEAAIDGKVQTVVINPEDFGALDIEP